MMTRLIVNLSQVYIPLFVTDSLFLDKVSLIETIYVKCHYFR